MTKILLFLILLFSLCFSVEFTDTESLISFSNSETITDSSEIKLFKLDSIASTSKASKYAKKHNSFVHSTSKINYGFFTILSANKGSKLYINGHFASNLPVERLKIPVSKIKYKIISDEYKTYENEALIQVNENFVKEVHFIPKKINLAIITTPTDCEVYVNDKLFKNHNSTTNNNIEISKVGTAKIHIRKKNYKDTTILYNLPKISNYATRVNLKIRKSGLRITSKAKKSYLYIDNTFCGTILKGNELFIKNINPKEVTIEVLSDKCNPWQRNVFFEPGKVKSIDITHRPNKKIRIKKYPLGEKNGSWGDSDGDGIKGDKDLCPNDPEDFDNYEDLDGCIDWDNDADGIPDNLDKCPLEKEDFDGFEDADGCPDLDNDGDGIIDTKDLCLFIKEDIDGFEDFDGCPDYDNDKDGVADSLDEQANEPEDIDGNLDNDGIPEDDNDFDGIKDYLDLCPNEAEVFNNFMDNDGCPDNEVEILKSGSEFSLKFNSLDFDFCDSIYSRISKIYESTLYNTKIRLEISIYCYNLKERINLTTLSNEITLKKVAILKSYFENRNLLNSNRYTIKVGEFLLKNWNEYSERERIENTQIKILVKKL